MKKILLLFSIMLLSSCSPKFIQYSNTVDFEPYLKDGFFITMSNLVSFEYEPLGYVEGVAVSGNDKNMKVQREYKKEFEKDFYSSEKWRTANSSDAMETLVKRCRDMGATGIINLKFQVTTDIKTGGVLSTYASGMAIKRK